MSDDTRDSNRQLGVEFGRLDGDLEGHDYPASTTDLLDAFGGRELELVDKTRTFREVLSVLEGAEGTTTPDPVSFDSPEDVKRTILNFVDDAAIGRKGYSDRTPYAPGEDRQCDPESF